MTDNIKLDSSGIKANALGAIPSSVIAVLVIVMLSAMFFMEYRIKKSVNEAVKEDVIQSIETSKSLLVSSIVQYQKDIKFLEKSSAVIEFSKLLIHSKKALAGNLNNTRQHNAVKQTFLSMMQQHLPIEQLRVISYPVGNELIRMERRAGSIIDVAPAALQNKGSRDYFLEAALVNLNEIYISDINLNRENGEIQYPTIPTIRLAIPLSTNSSRPHNDPIAVLVVNINVQYLLDNLVERVDPRFSAFLLNEKQEFLVHPKLDKAFSHEFTEQYSWATEFGRLGSFENTLTQLSSKLTSEPKFAYIKQNFVLSSASHEASTEKELTVTLVIGIPQLFINAMRNDRRLNTFGLAGLFTVMVIVLLLFFNAYVKRNIMLNRAKSEYQAIVDGSADAIIAVSLMGVITTWNKASEELFAISAPHAINKTFDELITLPNVSISALIEEFKASPHKTNTHCETTLKSHNDTLSLELSISAITTLADGIIGLSIICKDLTLHKRAQAQVNNINQSLEHQVAERTKELELAKNEAEHANVVKSAFISNVSHEMRTPLNGISGTLELITKEPLSDTQKSYLQMTETSISSLTVLINDILDLSKIEAGKMTLDKVSFDLIDEFEKILVPVALKAYSKGLVFMFDTSGVELRSLVGDKNRINQITNNILSNAVKFTEDGEVSIYLQSHKVAQGVVILCAISDTGIGIDKRYYNRIFGSFNQEDTSISSKFGGTGLGLSICKQLSKLMNGDVTFSSEKGQGSTFYFSILVDPYEEQYCHSALLRNVHISLVCEHQKEASSIKANLKSYGAIVSEINHIKDMIPHSNIMIIDGHHPQKQLYCDAFTKIAEPYSRIITMLTPQIFANRSQAQNSDSNWDLMKPFTTGALIGLLNNSDGYNTLTSVAAPLANKISKCAQQKPTSTLLKSVLIVDDNDINIEVIKGMISDYVDRVFSASNGKDALLMLKRTAATKAKFDLILLDCNMPIMDGFECVKRIRLGEAGQIYENVPVVAVTADAMLGDQERCLNAGMSDYLSKPIQSNKLIETLTKWSL